MIRAIEVCNHYFMNILIVFALISFAVVMNAQNNEENKTVETVQQVNLKRYVGLWYEIAKIPNFFQKKCKYGTTALYTMREDGNIDVTNSCYDEDGEIIKAEGLARIVDKKTNAKLEVSFVSIFGLHLFWGDYWIIGLGENYEYAVVGTPDRKYGWVLSRTPVLSKDKLEEAYRILLSNGYDTNDFVLTSQKR
jgi:apolipoprotein D and lipocalin family protein